VNLCDAISSLSPQEVEIVHLCSTDFGVPLPPHNVPLSTPLHIFGLPLVFPGKTALVLLPLLPKTNFPFSFPINSPPQTIGDHPGIFLFASSLLSHTHPATGGPLKTLVFSTMFAAVSHVTQPALLPLAQTLSYRIRFSFFMLSPFS